MLVTEYKLVESGLHRTELQVDPSTPGGTRPKAGEDPEPSRERVVLHHPEPQLSNLYSGNNTNSPSGIVTGIK